MRVRMRVSMRMIAEIRRDFHWIRSYKEDIEKLSFKQGGHLKIVRYKYFIKPFNKI